MHEIKRTDESEHIHTQIVNVYNLKEDDLYLNVYNIKKPLIYSVYKLGKNVDN